MLEFSCADFSFPLLTRMQALSLLRLLDFNFVDLGLFERNDHLRTSAMLAAPRQFALDLAEDLDRAELAVADVFLQIGAHPGLASVNDPEPEQRSANRDVFKRSLELCVGLNCTHMTGLPGVFHGDLERDFARAAEETHWRVELARTFGITYAIEPHIGSICSDIVSTRRLLDAVPHLTLTLDYGHFVAAGYRAQDVHSLLPHATHVHVRGGAPGHLQTSVAENNIPFDQVLHRLHQLNFKGKLAFEYVWVDWEGCNRSDTLSETIALRQAIGKIADSLQEKAGIYV
jgi:sugar phosphate isomerase/epimerase